MAVIPLKINFELMQCNCDQILISSSLFCAWLQSEKYNANSQIINLNTLKKIKLATQSHKIKTVTTQYSLSVIYYHLTVI
jgi:hypothetical protein